MRISPLIPLAVAALVAGACETPMPTAEQDVAFSAVNADGSVNKPFKAAFTTASTGAVPDAVCGVGPYLLEHQVGEGEATHLGRFTVEFTFCIDVTDLLDDGQLTAGESIPYWDGVGVLTAANGDELWVGNIEGEIVPTTRPGFNYEFHDEYDFTGGTGRFSGAYGSGTTDSYVQASPNQVVHDWNGTVAVFPGS